MTEYDDSMRKLSPLHQAVGAFLAILGALLVVLSVSVLQTDWSAIARIVGEIVLPVGVALLASRLMVVRLGRELSARTLASVPQAVERDASANYEQQFDVGRADQLEAVTTIGIESLFQTRIDSLVYFGKHLDAEIQRSQIGSSARVWIVCTSLKGFLEVSVGTFDGRVKMREIVQSGCDLRIMMANPEGADIRARQENRTVGEIFNEVRDTVKELRDIGVKRDAIRLYRGAPTVFTIATTDYMLLNPYPFQRKAFRCFSIVVRRTDDPTYSIFHQYLGSHVEAIWHDPNTVAAADVVESWSSGGT